MTSMSRQFASLSRGRVRAAATAALLLVAGLFASSLGAAPSDAATPPDLLVSVRTNNAALEGPLGAPTSALPVVLAAKGSATILVTITVSDGTELSKGTVINLTPVRADSANPLGSFSPGAFSVPTKGSTFTFPVAYSAAEDGIALRAALKKTTSTSPQPGQSSSFDVLDKLTFTPKGDPSLATGVGADTCNNRSNDSVCGVVVLPQGIGSDVAALSTGSCTDPLCTSNKEVQFIAGLQKFAADGVTPVDIYSRTNPAKLLLQCDKTQCPGKGVSFYEAKATLSATGPLEVSEPCTSKGVIQSTEDFCTDYVSSKRNNAGDLILVVLFFRDLKGAM